MNAVETSREKLYRAAVGPRADFYVPLFLKFDEAGASGRSWNWPAFFVSFYWFLYRRMFGQWTLYCLLIPIAVALVAAILAQLGVSPFVGDVLCLGYAFGLLPLTANHLYYRAIQQRIAAVRAEVPGRGRPGERPGGPAAHQRGGHRGRVHRRGPAGSCDRPHRRVAVTGPVRARAGLWTGRTRRTAPFALSPALL